MGGGEHTHRPLQLRARGWRYSHRCMPSPKSRWPRPDLPRSRRATPRRLQRHHQHLRVTQRLSSQSYQPGHLTQDGVCTSGPHRVCAPCVRPPFGVQPGKLARLCTRIYRTLHFRNSFRISDSIHFMHYQSEFQSDPFQDRRAAGPNSGLQSRSSAVKTRINSNTIISELIP